MEPVDPLACAITQARNTSAIIAACFAWVLVTVLESLTREVEPSLSALPWPCLISVPPLYSVTAITARAKCSNLVSAQKLKRRNIAEIAGRGGNRHQRHSRGALGEASGIRTRHDGGGPPKGVRCGFDSSTELPEKLAVKATCPRLHLHRKRVNFTGV
jgi:hypothetical protein